MGIKKKAKIPNTNPEPPKLARRSANRRSTLKTGRTLSAKREHLETSSERASNHQKIKRRQRFRFIISAAGLLLAIAAAISIGFAIIERGKDSTPDNLSSTVSSAIIYKPTIEIIDEDTGGSSGSITTRMSEYIGQAEVDFRELGLIPVKAVIPAGAVREVDFYLDNHPGYIKMVIDRGTAVSAEDAFRMIRYLEEQGITDYQYIDVRLPGRAYWK